MGIWAIWVQEFLYIHESLEIRWEFRQNLHEAQH